MLLTITSLADRYTWDVVFDGSDGNTTYNMFHIAHAEASKDQKNGFLSVSDPVTSQASALWTWGIDGSGVFDFKMTAYDSGTQSNGVKINLVVNPDQSGDLEYNLLENAVADLQFKSTGQSTGAGEWWTYNEGVVVNSGTW